MQLFYTDKVMTSTFKAARLVRIFSKRDFKGLSTNESDLSVFAETLYGSKMLVTASQTGQSEIHIISSHFNYS